MLLKSGTVPEIRGLLRPMLVYKPLPYLVARVLEGNLTNKHLALNNCLVRDKN